MVALTSTHREALKPIVVITGVTRGLGRAMTQQFAASGYTVIGCARSERELSELRTQYPGHSFRRVNVASDEEVAAWARDVDDKVGAPILILNNAAMLHSRAPLWQIPPAEASDVIGTNIKGTINVVRHFVPLMLAHKRGVIVNFSSRWGRFAEPALGPYCASKWALIALTKVLAEELKPYRISVVALNPGIVATDMLHKYLAGAPCPPGIIQAADWAKIAVPFIQKLGLKDSGHFRRIPLSKCISAGQIRG